MIYHDIPWYIPWYTMILKVIKLSSTDPASSCGTRSPGGPGRIRTCWSLRVRWSPPAACRTPPVQYPQSPEGNHGVGNFQGISTSKMDQNKVFIIIMGVIWKTDLTCLNYSQVISCDITVAISTTSTRSNTLFGGWNPYIPRPQPRNCLHQTLVSAQRSPWQHPGEQKTQGCPKAGSPQTPVVFHQCPKVVTIKIAMNWITLEQMISTKNPVNYHQFISVLSIQTAISARIRAGQTHNATGHGTPRNAMPV